MARKEKIITEEAAQCPECGGTYFIKDSARGEVFCKNCGLVIDENLIDFGPEWRAFDDGQHQKRARTGPPSTFTIHDKGLSTEISWVNKDFSGKAIPSRSRPQLYRMRKWQKRISVGKALERNLSVALTEINRMVSVMNLPRDVRETAALIYRKVVSKDLLRGRSIEGMVAAVLYAACRQCNIPRTLNEIQQASGKVPRKIIGRNYRFLSAKIGLKLLPPSPRDYISRFCSQLHVNREIRSKAVEIIKEAEKKELLSGRGPIGLAAASVYIASILCGEKKTQKEIAEVTGVTEVTIRNRYKELAEQLGLEADIYSN